MSDLSDVLSALAAIVGQTVYPNGTNQPSLTGNLVFIYPGWPSPAKLDQDLAAGNVNISIFPKNEERNTTRYPTDQQVTVPANPTLTATISGQTVTIGGTNNGQAQNIAINVNGTPYVYAVQPTDTLPGIATAFSILTGGANTGPVITLPPTARILSARVGAAATVAAELKRQEKVFMISIWANSPQIRDLLAGPIDTALAGIENLTMPDGYAARLIYKNTTQTDGLQKENLFKRDLNYSVEWATTKAGTAQQVIVGVENLTDPNQSTFTVNY
jgi:hypothetical protein